MGTTAVTAVPISTVGLAGDPTLLPGDDPYLPDHDRNDDGSEADLEHDLHTNIMRESLEIGVIHDRAPGHGEHETGV